MFTAATILLFVGIASIGGDFIEEGESCGSQWTCKKLSECRTAESDVAAGRPPQICSFDGSLPIVCCRPESSSAPGRPSRPSRPNRPDLSPREPIKTVSQRMCEKYAEFVFAEEALPVLLLDTQTEKINKCGRLEETLIVGGVDAKLREFPHMALIGYGKAPKIQWLCGGSLISESWILSAAHCTTPQSKGPASWAKVGDLDTLDDNDGAEPVTRKISTRINHPNYSKSRLYHDIALYKLESEVPLSPNIRPICLQVDHQIPAKGAIASGWGHTSWSGKSTNRLKKVNLPFIDNNSCNESYRSSIGKQLSRGIDGSTMVCAGEEGKDSCQGDSGGPLQIPLRTPYCTYAQVGVTSFGRGCAQNYPGVYTRVSYYVSWIESIVWPDQ